jgi:hypothetical protein
MPGLSSDPALAARQVANLQPAPPAPHGNERAVTHGARSEKKLAPLRDAFAGELRQRFPFADELRIALAADRLARWRCGTAWLDERGGVVRTRAGAIYDIADRVEKWSNRAEQVLTELEAEAHGGERVTVAQALSEPHPVLRASLLRAAGIPVDELPEEAERA